MLSASEEPHPAISRQWLRYGYRISHCGSIVAFLVSRLYQTEKKLHNFLRIQWEAENGRKNVLNDACPDCDSDYREKNPRFTIVFSLPERQPFNIGPYKIWPCFSKPEFQWFAAIDSKPFYFRSMNEARLFVNDLLSMEDAEGLCD